MTESIEPTTHRSDQLLAALAGYDECLVVMHDNPDPDAIATGWAICVLIEEKLGKPVRLVGRGAIVRAENRHLVDLLHPPIELVDNIDVRERTAAVLVDCSETATNHLLSSESCSPIAVLDHHTPPLPGSRLEFQDIRPHVAASATIAAEYLREQGLEPGFKLATAMLYAIRTETQGGETRHSPLDRQIVPWLTERAEPELLAEIENAPLAREYFGDLVLAMQNTRLYGDAALCFLPRAHGAEIVGEVADLLIRGHGVKRVLCAALVGRDLLFSARTERGYGDATSLLAVTLAGLGRGGGHAHRAGGKIASVGETRDAERMHDVLRDRWLAACGIARRRGTRLVPRREIVEHL